MGGEVRAEGQITPSRAEMPARQMSIDPRRREDLFYWELLSADQVPLGPRRALFTQMSGSPQEAHGKLARDLCTAQLLSQPPWSGLPGRPCSGSLAETCPSGAQSQKEG